MNQPTQPVPRFMTVRALRNAAQAVTNPETPATRTPINIPVCLDLYPAPVHQTEVRDGKHA